MENRRGCLNALAAGASRGASPVRGAAGLLRFGGARCPSPQPLRPAAPLLSGVPPPLRPLPLALRGPHWLGHAGEVFIGIASPLNPLHAGEGQPGLLLDGRRLVVQRARGSGREGEGLEGPRGPR